MFWEISHTQKKGEKGKKRTQFLVKRITIYQFFFTAKLLYSDKCIISSFSLPLSLSLLTYAHTESYSIPKVAHTPPLT